MSDPLVVIDSSYFNFYRFHATVNWYNYSPDRKEEAVGIPWLQNPVFMKTFEKMWFETLKKLLKHFKAQDSKVIFCRDGKNVWRYDLFPEYKANRRDPVEIDPNGNVIIIEDVHSPGPVFKYINANYHNQVKNSHVLYNDRAEADDIAAVLVRYVRATQPERRIIVITGDHDYLQLSEPGFVDLYTLKKFTEITCDDPHLALMQKVLAGDPSDNIPPIYKGCGKKTAEKLARDPVELEKMLEKKGRDQYELNLTLIDFNNIPEDIVEEIEAELDNVLE